MKSLGEMTNLVFEPPRKRPVFACYRGVTIDRKHVVNTKAVVYFDPGNGVVETTKGSSARGRRELTVETVADEDSPRVRVRGSKLTFERISSTRNTRLAGRDARRRSEPAKTSRLHSILLELHGPWPTASRHGLGHSRGTARTAEPQSGVV